MNWPTKAEVEKADRFQLAVWYRFLPLCENEDQLEIVNLIFSRFTIMGGFDPVLSKAVGLDKSRYEKPAPAASEPPIKCGTCGRRFFIDPKKTYEKHLPYCEPEQKQLRKGGHTNGRR